MVSNLADMMSSNSDSIRSAMGTVAVLHTLLIWVLVALVLLGVLFGLIGVIWGKGWASFVMSWIFSLFTILLVITAIFFFPMSVAFNDLCIAPRDNIRDAVMSQTSNQGALDAFNYYMTCGALPSSIADYNQTATTRLFDPLVAAALNVSSLCGNGTRACLDSFTDIRSLLTSANSMLTSSQHLLVETKDLIRCETVTPIYMNAEATLCNDLVNSMFLEALGQLLAVFAMLFLAAAGMFGCKRTKKFKKLQLEEENSNVESIQSRMDSTSRELKENRTPVQLSPLPSTLKPQGMPVASLSGDNPGPYPRGSWR